LLRVAANPRRSYHPAEAAGKASAATQISQRRPSGAPQEQRRSWRRSAAPSGGEPAKRRAISPAEQNLPCRNNDTMSLFDNMRPFR
jgi:hypothetical protein